MDLEQMHFGGEDRVFGTLPQTPEQLTDKYRVFGEEGPDATPPLILEKDWVPTWQKEGDSNDKYTNGIGDQKGQGACGCISACEIIESLSLKSGLPPKKLSWGQLYWSCNGDRDKGTTPEDVLKRLRTFGVASVDSCAIDTRSSHSNDPKVIADAKNYGIDEWFLAPTTTHLVSGLMQGFEAHTSIWWFSSDNVDSNGWLSDNPRGKRGGHSIRQNEFIVENGQKGFRFPNTWTPSWGVKGYGKISLSRIAETMKVWPFFLVRSVRQRDGTFPAPVQ